VGRQVRPAHGAAPTRLLRDYRGIALGISATYVLVGFETSAIAVTLPLAIEEFRVRGLAGGVLSAFAVMMVVGMTIASVLGTRLPIARVQVLSVTAMVVGLTLSAMAPSVWFLIAGRAIEGLGAGIALVAMYLVVSAAIPVHLRPQMFALISSSWVVPALMGPVVAGVLTSIQGWRLPFASMAFLAAGIGVFVCRSLWGQAAPTGVRASWSSAGWAVTAAIGLVVLQLAWQEGQGLTPWAAALGVVSVGTIALSARQLLPLRTLTAGPGLPGLVATRGLATAAIVMYDAWFPLFLIRERDASPAVAGLVVSACALGWLAGAVGQARLPGNRPRLRGTVVTACTGGLAVSVLATTLVAVTFTAPLVVIAAGWLLCGLCGGALVTSINVLVFGPYVDHDYPHPAAALQTSEALSSATLLAVAAVAFRAVADVAGAAQAFFWILALAALVAAFGAGAAGRASAGIRETLT
jgi:MFS family permease